MLGPGSGPMHAKILVDKVPDLAGGKGGMGRRRDDHVPMSWGAILPVCFWHVCEVLVGCIN